MLPKLASMSPLPQSQRLFEAVVKGDLKILRQLSEQGQDLVVHVKDYGRRVPALHFLAEGGHMDCIEFLAQEGEDLKQGDWRGLTCTDHALINNHPECFEVLLTHVFFNNPEVSFNYFHRAIALNNREMIITLAQIHQAQLHHNCTNLGNFAERAARQGALESLDALLALMPRNETTEGCYNRLAQTAAQKGDISTLNVVLKRAHPLFLVRDWQMEGKSGQTLLHVAKSEAVLEKLLSLGLDINAQDDNGRTPAHAAALDGRTDEFLALLQRKADLSLKDKDGATPFWVVNKSGKNICHYATERGPYFLVHLLKQMEGIPPVEIPPKNIFWTFLPPHLGG